MEVHEKKEYAEEELQKRPKSYKVVQVPAGWIAIQVYTQFKSAQRQAGRAAEEFDREEYVFMVEGGYIVVTYSEGVMILGFRAENARYMVTK